MMADQVKQLQTEDEQVPGRLLSEQERLVCQQLSAGEAPHSQRAQALLAFDEGTTQVAAGERSGLSTGQVHYWLGKFRKQRLDIFPDALLSQLQLKSEPTPSAAIAEQVYPEEEEAAARPLVKKATYRKSTDAPEAVEAQEKEADSVKEPAMEAKKTEKSKETKEGKKPKKAEEAAKPKKTKKTKEPKKAKKSKKPKKAAKAKKPKKKKKTKTEKKSGKKAKTGKKSEPSKKASARKAPKKKDKEGKGSKKNKKGKSGQSKSNKKQKKKKNKD